jgi:hypothetical protein
MVVDHCSLNLLSAFVSLSCRNWLCCLEAPEYLIVAELALVLGHSVLGNSEDSTRLLVVGGSSLESWLIFWLVVSRYVIPLLAHEIGPSVIHCRHPSMALVWVPTLL